MSLKQIISFKIIMLLIVQAKKIGNLKFKNLHMSFSFHIPSLYSNFQKLYNNIINHHRAYMRLLKTELTEKK